MAAGDWQVRRTGGRRIYTGLSRAQVEAALRSGKLRTDDLALAPGATRWTAVTVALIEHGPDEPRPARAEAAAVGDWAPMRKEGRLITSDGDPEDPAEMDMTPMIDVTTLLLIFFLIAGVFQLEAALQLPRAKSGSPHIVGDQKPVALLIAPGEGENAEPVIRFEDQRDTPVPIDQLAGGYRARVEAGSLSEVIVKAHRAVPFGTVRQAMRALAEAGAAPILIGIEEAR